MPELMLRYRTPNGWWGGKFEVSQAMLAHGIDRLVQVADSLVLAQRSIPEAKILLDGEEVHHAQREVNRA